MFHPNKCPVYGESIGLQVVWPSVDICCHRDATMPKRTVVGGGGFSPCRIPSLW